MASWVWTKLLNLFLPEDVVTSRKIVASLSLPSQTSQFVHALTDPRNPSSSVVYLLAVEKLSERSIEDIRAVVGAVRPNSVVAFVNDRSIDDIKQEENLLEGEEALHVPTSVFDVLKRSFLERSKASVYESRAGLRLLIRVFGTTFHGNIIAAKKAAEETQAAFEYFCFPSTATPALVNEEELKDNGPASGPGEESGGTAGESDPATVSLVDRFVHVLTGFLGGDGNSENLTSVTHQVATKSLSASYPQELRALAPSFLSTLSKSELPILALAEGSESVSTSDEHQQLPAEDMEVDCPSFAVPFYPVFVDLHNLFSETPFVNQALSCAKSMLKSVDNGDEVNQDHLARVRVFRVAVEAVRLAWNSHNYRQRAEASSKSTDFSLLSYEDKCYALLAQALKYQGEKCKTVVAVVDASSIPGIRKHWNTLVPQEVSAYAEHCFVPLNPGDPEEGSGLFRSLVVEKPETKAAVVVSAGAAAAVGLVSLPSVSTAAKILTFKVPSVLKIFFLQAKRTAFLSLSNVITPATNVVVPALKAVGSGKAAAVPSGAVKAVALKGAVSAEKARMAAQSLVAAAERASLQAIRTAFYSLMKNKQGGKLGGPRPWLMLAGTLTTAAGVWCYEDGIEHAIGIAPAAPALARLGRGLEKLDEAADVVQNVEGPSFWERAYETHLNNQT